MELKGTITKLNTELGYGFVTVKKLGEVFFSGETSFENAKFEELKAGQLVTITAKETPRGMFASRFTINSSTSSASASI